jgi:stearoyl-CoA desaturase (delta-9 desaturase)
MITRDRILAAFVVIVPPLGIAVALARGLTPSLGDGILLLVGSVLGMVGVELGYHRCFGHRAFEPHPALAWLLGILGSSALLGPVMWWVAIHRRHHAYTDREGDPHSPHWPFSGARGLWHAHAGWLFRSTHTAMSISAGEMRDLWKNPRTVALHRSYLLWGTLGLALPATIGGLPGLVWGGFARLLVVSHAVWAINSLGHARGGRARLARAGQARNNAWLMLPTLGGGLHANHHDAPRAFTTRAGRGQIDPGGALIVLLARLGLVKNLKRSGLRDEAEETA